MTEPRTINAAEDEYGDKGAGYIDLNGSEPSAAVNELESLVSISVYPSRLNGDR